MDKIHENEHICVLLCIIFGHESQKNACFHVNFFPFSAYFYPHSIIMVLRKYL